MVFGHLGVVVRTGLVFEYLNLCVMEHALGHCLGSWFLEHCDKVFDHVCTNEKATRLGGLVKFQEIHRVVSMKRLFSTQGVMSLRITALTRDLLCVSKGGGGR